MGGGTVPTPDDDLVELIKNQYIEPTHPGENIEYVAVTTPMEAWPLTGLVRLSGIALGPPEVWGPGGAGWWPDEPWWKLSGLFDLTLDQSVQAGVGNLEQAMAAHGNDHLVIYGISEGSISRERGEAQARRAVPGGNHSPRYRLRDARHAEPAQRRHFCPVPGPLPADHRLVVQRPRADRHPVRHGRHQPAVRLLADFPLYPINLIADLNAVLGGIYVHSYPWDVSLPADDPTKSPAYQGTHGDTSYYFFETQDLPLFGPLRTLGVPESLIDVVEPFFRVIVELGYDRSIAPWEPTPARLIPPLNPVTVVADLVGAIGEGINNALAITGSPAPLSVPASPSETANANVSEQAASRGRWPKPIRRHAGAGRPIRRHRRSR